METKEQEVTNLPAEATTPAALLQLAVSKDLDLTKLEKLMELQERWEGNQARKTYLDAMCKFQSEVPALEKKKLVSFNTTKYKYAPLGEITATIKETLFNCGLSYRWEIQDAETQLHCTCITSHRDGHSERTTMSAGKDASGGKNEIQQRGSTITYLQRYTLIAALGLSTADEDNDGRSIEPTKEQQPTEKQAAPANEKPWLNKWTSKAQTETTKEWKNTVDALMRKEKPITIATVENVYRVNKELKAELETIATSSNQQQS